MLPGGVVGLGLGSGVEPVRRCSSTCGESCAGRLRRSPGRRAPAESPDPWRSHGGVCRRLCSRGSACGMRVQHWHLAGEIDPGATLAHFLDGEAMGGQPAGYRVDILGRRAEPLAEFLRSKPAVEVGGSGSCCSSRSMSSSACLSGLSRRERTIRSIGSDGSVAPPSNSGRASGFTFPRKTTVSLSSIRLGFLA